MSLAITVTMDLRLRAEAVAAFTQMGDASLAATSQFPGCRSVRIVQQSEDETRILFIEEWESEEDYRKYIIWREERGEMEGLRRISTKLEIHVWPNLLAATQKDMSEATT